MLWVLLSTLSALAESLKEVAAKLSTVKTDEYTAALAMHVVGLVLTAPLLWFSVFPPITAEFWWANLTFLFITPAWSLLYMKALKLSQMSKVVPLLALIPMLTALMNPIFTAQPIAPIGWVGITLISAGVYFVTAVAKQLRQDPLSPFKNIARDPGATAMLGVVVLWSVGAHFTKMRVDGSSPLVSIVSGALVGAVTIWALAIMRGKPVQVAQILPHKHPHQALIGVFNILATAFSTFALAYQSAAYVFAVKRVGVVISFGFARHFFHEKITKTKVFGVILILLGVFSLAVS